MATMCSFCSRRAGKTGLCQRHHNARFRLLRLVNPDRELPVVKKMALKMYLGGECVVCGERDFDVLELDHKNNNGGEYRNRGRDAKYYANNPLQAAIDGVQLLCANCHRRKTNAYVASLSIYERLGLSEMDKKLIEYVPI